MKIVHSYICLLLCCFFMQSNTLFLEYLKEAIDIEQSISTLKKETAASKTNEKETEKETDNESKESDTKEENKEKELKEFKHLNIFSSFPFEITINSIRNSEDTKISNRFFEIETPPPRAALVV